MILSLNKRSAVLLALAGTLALAACDNTSDLGPANVTQPPVTLSALISMLFATSTTDTAIPLEINTLAIDTSSENASDPNYTALIGS
jgi:hypothetical protein